MTTVAAMMQNGRGEVLDANMLGRALYSEVFNSALSGQDVPGRLPELSALRVPRTAGSRLLPDWDAVAPSWLRCSASNLAGIPITGN
jgi:hypothetical protein